MFDTRCLALGACSGVNCVLVVIVVFVACCVLSVACVFRVNCCSC